MNSVLQDIRYGWRGLRKSPSFAAIAILTLALGVGANTAIFTVVDALLLKPLPYANPSRLVLIHAHNMQNPNGEGPFSLARFEQLRDNARSFSGVAVFTSDTFDLTGRGEPRQLDAARVSWNFFNVLGVQPVLGRGFTADEGQLGGTRVVILSHDFWMREFGGAANVIGQSLDLDSLSYMIVGVLPANFAFQPLGSVQPIWIPREFEMNIATQEHIQRGMGYLVGVGRLAPGVTLDQARAEMAVLDKEYVRDNAGKADADAKRPVTADPLSAAVVANLRPAVLVLMGAVGVVLLIACANVSSLLLARSLKRKKEIAVRTALGAARGVIIRQLLVDSLLLALLGAAAGIATGYAGVRALLALDPSGTAQLATIQMDWRVLLFALAIAIISGLLFGLAPALQISKTDLTQALREEGRSATGSRRSAMSQNALVVAQVALSMILLIGCGLLIRSFVQMVRLDPGFDASRVVTMEINLPPSKYAMPAQMVAFYNEILRQTASLPGVEVAEISSALPLNRTHMGQILAEGQPVVPLPQRPVIALQTISPDYGKVLRVPLIRGREFTAEDNQTVPTVAMVNQAFVREFWPNVNPLGRHVWIGSLASPVEVVGVYGDVKNLGLTAEAIPELFMPYPNLPWSDLYLSLRSAGGDAMALVPGVWQRLGQIDSSQPLSKVQTLEQVLESARGQARLMMALFGIFSGVALVLAIVGIYGVISYAAGNRMHEMGVRIALGASQTNVFRLVVGWGLRLAAAGVLIGLIAARALAPLMASLLYKVSFTDPLTILGSAILFLAAAFFASYIPARRAARTDPMVALRYE